MNTETIKSVITILLVGGADGVVATQPENLFKGERRRCNPLTYLHMSTTAAEPPARCAPVKAVNLIAPRTIVVTLA